MPYIKSELKTKFDSNLIKISEAIFNSGELCYCIYKLLILYLNKNEKNFSNLSQILSSIECAKLEFYRKEIAPYEDKKIIENGDVK